jgi:hypothetical protein
MIPTGASQAILARSYGDATLATAFPRLMPRWSDLLSHRARSHALLEPMPRRTHRQKTVASHVTLQPAGAECRCFASGLFLQMILDRYAQEPDVTCSLQASCLR